MTAPQRASLWAGVLVGIGLVAGVDEIVFHQLLGWHHLYDGSTLDVGLLTDGLLHLVELALVVVGLLWIGEQRQRRTFERRSAVAGTFLGAGGFQLWDGLVNHKLLGLHEVRYGVDPLPYDIAWNTAALVLLAVGVALLRRAAHRVNA